MRYLHLEPGQWSAGSTTRLTTQSTVDKGLILPNFVCQAKRCWHIAFGKILPFNYANNRATLNYKINCVDQLQNVVPHSPNAISPQKLFTCARKKVWHICWWNRPKVVYNQVNYNVPIKMLLLIYMLTSCCPRVGKQQVSCIKLRAKVRSSG